MEAAIRLGRGPDRDGRLVPRVPRRRRDGLLTRVAVTGAGGYLGGRLVAHLHQVGTEVRALARRPAPWLPVAPVVGELAADALGAALDGADAVVHLAGADEVAAAADPDGTTAATVAAARAVAGAAHRAGIRLVYVSTVHVYGTAITDGAVLTEGTEPAPTSAYAAARLACERTCTESGIDAVVLRLTNGVGAPPDPAVDRWSLVANDLCRQAVATGWVELRTHGLQWRDFIPLADVVDAITRAADPAQLPPATYNLASGRPRTVRDLAGLVQDAAEQRLGVRPPLLAPAAPGHAPAPYTVSIERLAAQGWKPEASLRDAIDETLEFCIAHRDVR